MEKQEIDKLVEELNDLSEFEEQNMERMREIATILVDFYMPNRKKKCLAEDDERESKKED